jgi:hypothetical protein
VKKLLLLSVVIATIVVPVLAARDPSPARAVKKTVVLMVLFGLFYLLAMRFIYPLLD